MTRRARDTSRGAAYLAEEIAFEGTVLAERPGGSALRTSIESVLSSGWWRAWVGDPSAVRRVRVRPAGDSHWAPSTGTLAIDPGEAWFVVTHELAHVAAGSVGEIHGPAWRGWNAALADTVFGEPFGGRLARSFADLGLEVAAAATDRPAAPLLPVAVAAPRRGGWRPAR